MERTGDARGAWQGTNGDSAATAGAGADTGRDANAFINTFSRFAPRLYDFLARLSGRTEAADALLRQAASQAAMGASSAAQWPSERAWFFSRAFAVLPNTAPAETGNLAAFATPDRARLSPGGDDEVTSAMARAVWRAVSALPHDQHALLHLRVREGMAPNEAADVLGITEGEATDRLNGLTVAVEETSRALFLLRHGRTRDAALNDLLAGRDANRLTPELRSFLRDYVRDTPSVRAMLAPVPPLAVYAAFAPLPIPTALAAESAESALPWLSTSRASAPRVPAEVATAMLPEQGATVPFDPHDPEMTGMLPETPPSAATALVGAAPPPPANEHGSPYAQPPALGGANAGSGTQMLNIPVRQRIVSERKSAVRPPPPPRRVNPAAVIGGLAGALVIIVGALVGFLSGTFGGANANARATATIGGTPALSGSVTTTIPDVLLTSTAIAENRILTTTAQAGTPTPIPTPQPQPVIRPPVAPEATGTAAVPTAPPTPAGTPEPRVTLAPTFAPAPPVAPEPRVTLAPPVAPRDPVNVSTVAPTRPATSAASAAATARPSAAATSGATSVATTAATAARTVVSTAAPTVAPTAATRAATAATTAAPPAATPAATAASTMPATAATPTAVRTAAAATPATAMPAAVTANTMFLIVNTNPTGALTLTNKGAATNFTAAASGRGVSVSPASGTIGANGTANLTVTVNRAGLMMGNYGGNVVVTTGSGTVTVIVSYSVP